MFAYWGLFYFCVCVGVFTLRRKTPPRASGAWVWGGSEHGAGRGSGRESGRGSDSGSAWGQAWV